MGKKDSNDSWFWLVVILLILLFLWVVSRVSNSTKVNDCRKYYQEKADALKKEIGKQEGVVSNINDELKKALFIRNYLINKARRIWFGIKYTGAVLVIGSIFVMHGIYMLSVVEVIAAITGTVGFVYFIFSVLIWNEVKQVNEVLTLFQITITKMIFRQYSFEPALIEALQTKLEYEISLLEQMKTTYNEMVSSNHK